MVRATGLFALLCMAAGVQTPPSTALPKPPGSLVDVGGRRLHAICTGSGSPTVVLEAGASSFAIDWTLVQRAVQRTHRVCAYDRADMGWSDPSGNAAAVNTARDLHSLLERAGERPPYLLVGASRGGLLIRTFLLEYPEEVAGLVFLDPASEERLFTLIGGEGVLIATLSAEQLKPTFPREPVRVPRRSPQKGDPFDRLPPEVYQQRILLDERLIASVPETVPPEAVAAMQEADRAMLARLLASRKASPHPFGDRPTIVLSRGSDRNAEREAVHASIARLSSNGRHAVVPGAGHEIHLFEPAVVIQAIEDVTAAIRSKATLPVR